MSEVNKYTEKALERYVQMKNPQFAALISGEWGTGKTWFVKNFFATHAFDKKFCYISLFDIESIKEIDAALIDQIAHLTESKCIRIASKVTRFAIEKYTGYDIQAIEDLGKKISEKIPEGVVVCLDDIERSRLKIKTVFGYVSNLLEQFESNVVLICNANKVKNKAFFDENLEKIVGIHLSVEKDLYSFIDSSIGCIQDHALKDFLFANKSIIVDYFYQYEMHSMRYIRILIHHFEALYSSVEHKQNENYIKSLLVSLCEAFFNRFSLEHSEKTEDSISGLRKEFFKNDTMNHYGILCPILDEGAKSFWDKFFKNGIIDHHVLQLDYDNSLYNERNKNTPMRLWNYYFLDDEFVLSTYKTILEELENGKYTSASMFFRAVCVVFEMVDINIEERNIDVNYFKKIIDNTNFDTSQEDFDEMIYNVFEFDFIQSNRSIFVEIKKYLFDKLEQLYKNMRADMFNNMLENIGNSDCSDFRIKLNDKNYSVNLEKIDISQIIKSISMYKNSTVLSIMDMIHSIISNNIDSPFFIQWATELISKIEQEAAEIKSTQKIKYLTLQRSIALLKSCLKKSQANL